MKILFVMRHPAAVRSLDSVLRMLDQAGHQVHLAFGGIKPEAHKVLQRLADDCRGLTFGDLPSRGSPGWARDAVGWNVLSRRLRVDSDYLRYLEPSYADAPALRARAEGSAHPLVRRLGRVAQLAGPRAVRALRHTLEFVERCLEPPPHVERFLVDFEPDVVVTTHLARDSVQADYVRAANRLGLHSAYPVFSWDNLTNKGLVHELPELVLVWNELQANEAVELQAIPRERVRVLGAWSYDHWFRWTPSRTREAFCKEAGLRPEHPIILYVCSSGFVARDEVAFVCRWLQALRSHGGLLADAGVVVRPHPRNAAQWAGASLEDAQAKVWPRFGEEPLEVVSRQNYFDSIHYASAVVGINTSAQIESAIVGRPVHTVLADEFRDTQQGTLHFQYLRADEFGHLYVGRTMAEHLDQLDASLRGRADHDRNERFLRRFVRPLGLDVEATPLYVETIEELGSRPSPKPDRGPALAPVVRRGLAPLAAAAGRRAAARRKQSREAPDELHAAIRKLRRKRDSSAVLAYPWLGSELTELLYWIPFLRWAQTATYGLRDRLIVVSRVGVEPWYAGIGSRYVRAEDVLTPVRLAALVDSFPEVDREELSELLADVGSPDPLLLVPRMVESRRRELSEGDPAGPFQRRRLEFAPLAAPELPAGLDLPDEFVASRLEPRHADLVSAVAERRPVVPLDGLDRSVQAAVLARSCGFVGSYGIEAYLALLLGRPAVAFSAEHADPNDLRIASSFLARPPFGRLHVLEEGASADEDAERASRLLHAPVEALASV